MNLKKEPELSAKIHSELINFINNLRWMSQRVLAKNHLLDIEDEIAMAAERCIPIDEAEWNIAEAEIECTTIFHHDDQTTEQGTSDLVFVNHETQTFKVADWKRVGYLPVEKIDRYSRSYQPVMYMDHWQQHYPDYTGEFEFRFVVAGSGQVAPNIEKIILPMDKNYLTTRLTEMQCEVEQIQHCTEVGIWPRREKSCMNWGRTCEFHSTCWDEKGNQDLPKPAQIILSQSLIGTFGECQRKYYYTLEAAEGADYHTTGDSGPAALLGSMFHHGISLVYDEVKLRANGG